MDAKAILGLPKTPLPIPQEKKSRPHKDSQRKPDGISRELEELKSKAVPNDPVEMQRREKVKEAMVHAWSSYERYAWGNDELQTTFEDVFLAEATSVEEYLQQLGGCKELMSGMEVAKDQELVDGTVAQESGKSMPSSQQEVLIQALCPKLQELRRKEDAIARGD